MAADDKTKEAWDEYLSKTRPLRGRRYARVEPYAWAQLRAKLGRLKPARKAA